MARLTSNHREADVTTTRTGRRLLTVAAAAAAALVAAPAAGAAPLTPTPAPRRQRRAAVRGLGERFERHARRQPAADLALHRRLGSRAAPAAGRHPGRHRPDPSAQHPRPAGVARDAAAAGRAARAERGRQRPRCRQGRRRGRTTGDRDYTFTASRPGTFLYEAGPTPSGKQQVAMGLAGAIVVLPSTAGTGVRLGRHRLRRRGRDGADRGRSGAERRSPTRPRSTSAT